MPVLTQDWQPNGSAFPMDLSVVIPIYNEAATVQNSISELHAVLVQLEIPFEILVVESNSDDGSREILKGLQHHFNFHLILQDKPEGKGSAVKIGIQRSSGNTIMIFDGDNEYTPADIPALLLPIKNEIADMVLGTRHSGKFKIRVMENSPAIAAVMNFAHYFFLFLFNFVYRSKLSDPFTMYKIFRKSIFDGYEFQSKRFDLDWEIVSIAIRRRARIVEIPIKYTSRSFVEGKKVRLFLDPLTWILALVRFRFIRISKESIKND